MVKYHVNYEGDVKVCDAKIQCRFGSDTPHYETTKDAMDAFAKTQVLFKKISKRSFGDTELKHADNIVKLLVDEDDGGLLLRPEPDDDDDYSLGEYKYVGGGVESHVYLDPDKNFVYKVPNADSVADVWSEDSSFFINDSAQDDAKAYENLDKETLKEYNIRPADTHFITVQDANGLDVPVVVQEYLSDDLYKNHKLSYELQQEIEERAKVYDLHYHNVKQNIQTGEIVIFDYQISLV